MWCQSYLLVFDAEIRTLPMEAHRVSRHTRVQEIVLGRGVVKRTEALEHILVTVVVMPVAALLCIYTHEENT